MDKKAIVSILEEMGILHDLRGGNPFKARAFHNASRVVEGIPEDLQSLVESGEILEVDGIGEGIAEIIGDLLRKGKSKEHAALRKGFPDGVLEMLKIPGLGPKKVKVLVEKLKIRRLDQLEKAARANRLASLAGFGEKTERNILRGIEALRTRGDKSLYPAAAEAAEKVLATLRKQPGVVIAEVAGSLRRHKEVVGDIDILVSAKQKDRPRLMQAFVSHPDVRRVVAQGETKSSVVLAAGINCDVRIVNDAEFPFALNYFTGSKEHNVELRSRAKTFGWSLNEYGFSELSDQGTPGKAKRIVKCKTETDIYRALDLAYIPPELRENLGEIEAAERGTLPALVDAGDIRGTFHCHTTYSDGVNTIEEMAVAAQKLGWEYLGVADHSKGAAYAGGLTEDRVKAQQIEIDVLNAKMSGFRIFKGTECDILPSGDLDWPDQVLATFDYVVASVHSSFNMTEAEMTRRIIQAIKNKHVTMLGHPTGRLLLSREGYAVDMVQVIHAAADNGTVIELNAHPMRLDLDWRLCKYAKEKGVVIAINPDAHNVQGLRDVLHGVGAARKGWLEKKDILNTRNLNGVREYFRWS